MKRFKNSNVRYVMPIEDCSTRWLSKNTSYFREQGVETFISPPELLKCLDDKWEFNHILKEHVLIPKTIQVSKDSNIDEVLDWCQGVGYPVYLKVPYDTDKGVGVTKISSKETMRKTMRNIGSKVFVIQQGISGNIVNPQCIYTNGKLRSVFSSVSDNDNVHAIRAADTPHINTELIGILEKIGQVTNYHGMMDVEFIFTGDEYYLMEINPRMSGGIYMVFYYAIGFLNDYIDLLQGKDIGVDLRDRTPKKKGLKMYYCILAIHTAFNVNLSQLKNTLNWAEEFEKTIRKEAKEIMR